MPRATEPRADRLPAAEGFPRHFAGATDTGLRLRRAGDVDVCYSNGTWIGATGRTTAVPARWDSGRILLTVPAKLIEASTYPAVLDPLIVVTPITQGP